MPDHTPESTGDQKYAGVRLRTRRSMLETLLRHLDMVWLSVGPSR